jgi:hypothetical protein
LAVYQALVRKRRCMQLAFESFARDWRSIALAELVPSTLAVVRRVEFCLNFKFQKPARNAGFSRRTFDGENF